MYGGWRCGAWVTVQSPARNDCPHPNSLEGGEGVGGRGAESIRTRWWRVYALGVVVFLLQGCATWQGTDPAAERAMAAYAEAVSIPDVPFFPQTDLHCGPAALATLMAHSGLVVDYANVVERVYLPGRQGTLQPELLAALRAAGRIPYRLDPVLDAVFAEVAAGHPVLVLENHGLRRFPVWHYAVVIGFDPLTRHILQHSGEQAMLATPLREWYPTWSRAGRWALVGLRPGEMPAVVEQARWYQALAEFESQASASGEHQEVLAAWQQAAEVWPDAALPWLGQGNVYVALENYESAMQAYQSALDRQPDQVGARFNLAVLKAQYGDEHAAQILLEPLLDHEHLGARAREMAQGL